jgi:DNA-directed RNA polymerase specialized sigma24 family protein
LKTDAKFDPQAIAEALDSLSPMAKLVLTRHVWDDMTPHDIARLVRDTYHIEMPIALVNKYLYRALKHCYEHLVCAQHGVPQPHHNRH